ncbi:hypothetical protein [Ferruginibacter sp.]
MNKLVATILILLVLQSQAQTSSPPRIFRITSSYTSFPDTGRINGHVYDKVLYTAAEHYSDSSVMIVVPPYLKADEKVDVVVWFHGWWNNIDSVPVQFDIIQQFLKAGTNAILVLPETTKNAPDSYGGKLEQQHTFKFLLSDVLDKLKKEKIIAKRTAVGNVVLAGHSGAFRVMAHILQNGNVEIKQTILFDALYSQVDKFTDWINAENTHQFINIYTDSGGTAAVSTAMMHLLKEKNIAFIHAQEKEVTRKLLQSNRVVFIHTLKEHNDIMNRPDNNFQLYLENSHILQSIH